MSEKKELNVEELEKVNGGRDYVETKMPDIFYGAIDKYKVEQHKGENLYFVRNNTFIYGTVNDSREDYTIIPTTTRNHYVLVIATNRPSEVFIGREEKLHGDTWQAYLGAQYN